MLLWKHMGIHQTDALQPATRCLTAGDGTGPEYQLYRKTGKNPSSISKKGEMKSASSARPCPQREGPGETRLGANRAQRGIKGEGVGAPIALPTSLQFRRSCSHASSTLESTEGCRTARWHQPAEIREIALAASCKLFSWNAQTDGKFLSPVEKAWK